MLTKVTEELLSLLREKNISEDKLYINEIECVLTFLTPYLSM